jgi:hypothetical protein
MHFPKYLYMYVDYARFVHVWWPVWISDMEKSKNTCSEHISTSFIRVPFSGSLEKKIRLSTITCIYLWSCFHDPCGPQSKQLPNCLKIAETSVVLNVFKGASSVMSALTLLPFLSVAQQESGTRKAIFWSVTIYKKKLSSQCNLTAQIEPVQDK